MQPVDASAAQGAALNAEHAKGVDSMSARFAAWYEQAKPLDRLLVRYFVVTYDIVHRYGLGDADKASLIELAVHLAQAAGGTQEDVKRATATFRQLAGGQ